MNGINEDFKELSEIAPNTQVAPAVGIAAIALNMAVKYHCDTVVKDGALYQQYKLEGKNMTELHLDTVFETAIRMEKFLLGADQRIAKIVVDALEFKLDDEASTEPGSSEVTR